MLELIQENNVIIGIIIGIITLFITMRQIIISNQKHRMDKEDFISKRPNFSVYIENCYRISYNSSKHTHAVFCITIKNKSSSTQIRNRLHRERYYKNYKIIT